MASRPMSRDEMSFSINQSPHSVTAAEDGLCQELTSVNELILITYMNWACSIFNLHTVFIARGFRVLIVVSKI